MKKFKLLTLQILLLFVFCWNSAFAQPTEFTYQGRLTDGAVPPTAAYDFEFRLFAVESGGAADVGFGAEEVARVEPLLTIVNEKGETQGLKYAQMTIVLVNAVREQQAQIEAQNTSIKQLQERIKQQELLIAALRPALCGQNPAAEICQQ